MCACVFPIIYILIAWCFVRRYMTTLLMKQIIYRNIIILNLPWLNYLAFSLEWFLKFSYYLFSSSVLLERETINRVMFTRRFSVYISFASISYVQSNSVLCSRLQRALIVAIHNSGSAFSGFIRAALSHTSETWFRGAMYWLICKQLTPCVNYYQNSWPCHPSIPECYSAVSGCKV